MDIKFCFPPFLIGRIFFCRKTEITSNLSSKHEETFIFLCGLLAGFAGTVASAGSVSAQPTDEKYAEVVFVGAADSRVKQIMDAQDVKFVGRMTNPAQALFIVDGSCAANR